MANHFFAINRGLKGFAEVDIVKDTSSTAAADFELRIADVDGQGVVPDRMGAILACEAFIRMLQSGAIFTTFPPK